MMLYVGDVRKHHTTHLYINFSQHKIEIHFLTHTYSSFKSTLLSQPNNPT